MGIYNDGNVYGVGWRLYDGETELVRHFEKTYPEKMTLEQIQEVKEQYDLLTYIEQNNITIRFFTSCSSTYDAGSPPYMSWWPGDKLQLTKLFLKGDICI